SALPPSTTPTSTLPLHDALPISSRDGRQMAVQTLPPFRCDPGLPPLGGPYEMNANPDETVAGHDRGCHVTIAAAIGRIIPAPWGDRKSTRLNSSHGSISYAVFCF